MPAVSSPDSAIIYSQNAIEIFGKNNNEANSAYILHNIAGAYSKKKNNSMAMEYFHRALERAIQDSSARYQNNVYVGLAEHYMRNDQIDSSIHFARKAIDVVQGTSFIFLSIKPAKNADRYFWKQKRW